MPDYDIDVEHKSVGVTIYGQMLDERYTTLLKSHKDILLKECVWLDAIQKNRVITDDAVKHLKSKKLIEGRKPNYIIAAHIAQQTHQLADYTRKKGVEEEAVKQMILQLFCLFLCQFKTKCVFQFLKSWIIFQYFLKLFPSCKDSRLFVLFRQS